MEVMDQYKSNFGIDFADNKKALDEISVINSKRLKNEIAGFITKFIKREIRLQKEKEEREKQFNRQSADEQPTEISEPVTDSADTPVEDAVKPATETQPVIEQATETAPVIEHTTETEPVIEKTEQPTEETKTEQAN